MGKLDKMMNHMLGRMESDSERFYHVAQTGEKFKLLIYIVLEFFI